MKKIILCVMALGFLSACNDTPEAAYYGRGAPESLVDVSNEKVTVSLQGQGSIQKLSEWINKDQPNRAVMACSMVNMECAKARDVLEQYGVKYTMANKRNNTVELHYEKITARDCNPRYMNNASNNANLNHPTFGCATAANMVQMIGDRRQIVNPALSDDADGEKAVQAVDAYQAPKGIDKAFENSSVMNKSGGAK